MRIQHPNELRAIGRVGAAATLALVLAACAGGARIEYQPAPGSYFVVPVQAGDNVSAVATRYQVGEEDIVAINNIYNRDARLTAKSIRIPAYGHLKDPRRQETRLAYSRNAPVESRALARPKGGRGAGKAGGSGKNRKPAAVTANSAGKGAKNNKLASANKGGKPRNTAAPAKKQAAAEPQWWDVFTPKQVQQTAAPTHSFLWPVKGRLLSAFGTGEGGERNDGINISAPRGAPVRAADAGSITYVGDALKGYGNLVLIKHDNGYVTAYAHSDTVTVARGDRVARGQIIAYAGATGDVSQPQVHFELRLNTRPVDPAPYLVASN